MDIKLMINGVLKKIAEEQNFVIQTTVKQKDNVFIVVIGTFTGKKSLLKVADLNDNKDFAQELKKNNVLEKVSSRFRNVINFPRVIKSGRFTHFSWVIREYVEGESLSGNFGDNRYFFGYDFIDNKFLDKKIVILDQVAIYLKVAQNKQFKNHETSKNLKCRYNFELNQYDWKLIAEKINLNLGDQLSYYEQIFSAYSNDANSALCFGDLNPGNILINSRNEVFFTDFEWLCLDNYLFDTVFLWLFLWRYPDWQTYLTNKLIISNKDKDFFRANVIRVIIAYYNGPVINLEGEKLKAFASYHSRHWIKYLKAAGESYEAIMNVKTGENR